MDELPSYEESENRQDGFSEQNDNDESSYNNLKFVICIIIVFVVLLIIFI